MLARVTSFTLQPWPTPDVAQANQGEHEVGHWTVHRTGYQYASIVRPVGCTLGTAVSVHRTNANARHELVVREFWEQDGRKGMIRACCCFGAFRALSAEFGMLNYMLDISLRVGVLRISFMLCLSKTRHASRYSSSSRHSRAGLRFRNRDSENLQKAHCKWN